MKYWFFFQLRNCHFFKPCNKNFPVKEIKAVTFFPFHIWANREPRNVRATSKLHSIMPPPHGVRCVCEVNSQVLCEWAFHDFLPPLDLTFFHLSFLYFHPPCLSGISFPLPCDNPGGGRDIKIKKIRKLFAEG